MKVGQAQDSFMPMSRQQSSKLGICPQTQRPVRMLGARQLHQITENDVGSVDGIFVLNEFRDTSVKVQLKCCARPAAVTKGESGEASHEE